MQRSSPLVSDIESVNQSPTTFISASAERRFWNRWSQPSENMSGDERGNQRDVRAARGRQSLDDLEVTHAAGASLPEDAIGANVDTTSRETQLHQPDIESAQHRRLHGEDASSGRWTFVAS